MLPEDESLCDSMKPPVDPCADSGVESHSRKDAVGAIKAASTQFTLCNGDGDTEATQASLNTKPEHRLKAEGVLSSRFAQEKEVSKEREAPALNSGLLAKDGMSPDAEVVGVLSPNQADGEAVPTQEEVFAECSQKRILGLLAAVLPRLKSGSTMSLINLDKILPLMIEVVVSNAGHLNETYHLTLGLLGQLIRRLTPPEVDEAVSKVLSAKHSLVATGDGTPMPGGWKTTHLLFSLGALCLDSRVGLDWACTMADILRALNASPQWHEVVAAFTDHCIKQLPFQLKHTNIFTLLVLVGFPEVLCTGTRSVYMDNANEAHDVIILKHFTEKNRAVVVDVKTRKRKTVKDLQLVQSCGRDEEASQGQLRQYLQHFVFIASHLLQASVSGCFAEAVEATWVLSLALKGLYKTLKAHAFEEIRVAFLRTGLLKLLVKKCSKGTGFSKTWLLRDLEILSIMLFSSKREISSQAEHKDSALDEGDQDPARDQSDVTPTDVEQSRLDPLEGLDETTKICFLMTHDALDAPLHILRAMYELQMKRTDSFFLEVQKRFDGDVVTTDERIRTLAQKWQPSKRLRTEEQNSKALDTDMIIMPCLSKPAPCHKATEESSPVTQKLITHTESDLQLSFAKQRRSKSSVLLHKELDSRGKKAVRGHLLRVNEATAVLYARHVLALLLAEWPDGVALSEEMLELSGPAHMTYILDMLLQLEEKQLCEKILLKVLRGCRGSMLATMALTACQFMEEPGVAVQVRESKHPYNNNTNFEDKVHIPGAIYLSVKFDAQCNTEEGCDELLVASSCDFVHDRHTFSGPPHKWTDFELPGNGPAAFCWQWAGRPCRSGSSAGSGFGEPPHVLDGTRWGECSAGPPELRRAEQSPPSPASCFREGLASAPVAPASGVGDWDTEVQGKDISLGWAVAEQEGGQGGQWPLVGMLAPSPLHHLAWALPGHQAAASQAAALGSLQPEAQACAAEEWAGHPLTPARPQPLAFSQLPPICVQR
ncbi:Zinc finger ZZ-type and EF-hand domain-containing protein 1 [Varanus komodoensis]|nr:Zinc finger ZZ-type and EF-hand domain-containing protein 1 [Varanus komodoensis]